MTLCSLASSFCQRAWWLAACYKSEHTLHPISEHLTYYINLLSVNYQQLRWHIILTYFQWIISSWGDHEWLWGETIHPRHCALMSVPDLTLQLFLLQIPKSYVTYCTSCHHNRVAIWKKKTFLVTTKYNKYVTMTNFTLFWSVQNGTYMYLLDSCQYY